MNGRYIIMWQGAKIKTSLSTPTTLAPRQKLRYRLSLKEKADEAVLALRLEGEAQDKPTNDPTATALASVAAAQTVGARSGRLHAAFFQSFS